MKFSKAVKGDRAEDPVVFPGEFEVERDEATGAVCLLPDGTPKWKLDDKGEKVPVRFLVRPLRGLEEGEAASLAREYAKSMGTPEAAAKRGDAHYDLGWQVAALALGAMDKDSPKGARTPFFDGEGHPSAFDQVLGDVDGDVIAYLYERLDGWQSKCSPFMIKVSADKLLAMVDQEAASQDDAFFTSLSPALRKDFAHTLAVLVASFPELRSTLISFIDGMRSGAKKSISPPSESKPPKTPSGKPASRRGAKGGPTRSPTSPKSKSAP